jgi:cytochrome c-type biogenesis protein CcmF
MVIGPMLRWKRDTLRAAAARLTIPVLASVLAAVAVLAVTLGRGALAAAFMAVAAWLVFG